MQAHFRHHARFYASALLGLVAWLVLVARGSRVALVAAGDVSFVAYIVSALYVAFRATPRGMRKHAAYDDEGVGLIFVLTFAAIGVGLALMSGQ